MKFNALICSLFLSISCIAQGPIITVSTSGKESSYGLCSYRLQNGTLKYLSKSDVVESTSYHTFHPTKPLLFAVGNNRIHSFTLNRKTGDLTPINSKDTKGNNPCYVTVDKSGKYALVANYSGGTISVFPITEDGHVGEAVENISYTGKSIDTQRQNEPHPHMIMTSPDNKFVLVPDLGTDHIEIYKFDASTGKLTPNAFPFAVSLAGSGPRHLEFHPSAPYLYVLNELHSTVTAYHWKEDGIMDAIATYPMLPHDFRDFSKAADIHLTSDGKYLYATNRGHNSIVAYKVAEDGRLYLIDRYESGGDFPRNFFITPDDQYVLLANQNTSNIIQYKVDNASGKLTRVNEYKNIPGALCIKQL